MNIISFVLALIAAVVFLVLPDGRWGRRSAVAIGLFFLTLALMAQFIGGPGPIVIDA